MPVTLIQVGYGRRKEAIQAANRLTLEKQQQHRAFRGRADKFWRIKNTVTKQIVDSQGIPLP